MLFLGYIYIYIWLLYKYYSVCTIYYILNIIYTIYLVSFSALKKMQNFKRLLVGFCWCFGGSVVMPLKRRREESRTKAKCKTRLKCNLADKLISGNIHIQFANSVKNSCHDYEQHRDVLCSLQWMFKNYV